MRSGRPSRQMTRPFMKKKPPRTKSATKKSSKSSRPAAARCRPSRRRRRNQPRSRLRHRPRRARRNLPLRPRGTHRKRPFPIRHLHPMTSNRLVTINRSHIHFAFTLPRPIHSLSETTTLTAPCSPIYSTLLLLLVKIRA